MAYPAITAQIDKRRFEDRLRRLVRKADNLAPAFLTISKMFRQSRKSIWQLKSAGGYKDLSPQYKKWKTKTKRIFHQDSYWGTGRMMRNKARPYPILKLSGELEKSVTQKNHPNNVTIITKNSMALGTSMWYAKFHNSDKARGIMPLRKFIFWGPEAPRTMRNRTDETKNFAKRALNVIENYITRERGF